jgi:uncharacterized membrane protein YfcA
MTPLEFTLSAFGVSIVAGLLGSLLGLGGGIIVVPALTLLLKLDIRYAIGASIVSVIATSSGAAASYVKEHMTNLRVAMFLEVATASGALCGAYLAGILSGQWLFVIFGGVMGYTAMTMLRKRGRAEGEHGAHEIAPDRIADRLRLHGHFFDQSVNQTIHYRVSRTPLGLAVSYCAGIVSGLLGIGGGALKVPAMNVAMGVPIKVSTATSNFMIGVTAAASAGVYFMRGDIDPFVAAPVAAGVLIGARGGSKLMGRIKSSAIRRAFVIIIIWISVEMLLKGLLHTSIESLIIRGL